MTFYFNRVLQQQQEKLERLNAIAQKASLVEDLQRQIDQLKTLCENQKLVESQLHEQVKTLKKIVEILEKKWNIRTYE